MSRWAVTIETAQGRYFLITGAWPLVHFRSFLWVTGPKRDVWLVKTVGVLMAVIGAGLPVVGFRGRLSPETERHGGRLGLQAHRPEQHGRGHHRGHHRRDHLLQFLITK